MSKLANKDKRVTLRLSKNEYERLQLYAWRYQMDLSTALRWNLSLLNVI